MKKARTALLVLFGLMMLMMLMAFMACASRPETEVAVDLHEYPTELVS